MTVGGIRNGILNAMARGMSSFVKERAFNNGTHSTFMNICDTKPKTNIKINNFKSSVSSSANFFIIMSPYP